MSAITIRSRSGTEGPRHDPYSFFEWTLTLDAEREWIIHDGLGTWVRFNGQQVEVAHHDIDGALQRTGCPLTLREIEQRHDEEREAPIKEHAPHGDPCWHDGMPGEQLLICPCGAVLDSTFDLSAIE
jgi:hypothetical protein